MHGRRYRKARTKKSAFKPVCRAKRKGKSDSRRKRARTGRRVIPPINQKKRTGLRAQERELRRHVANKRIKEERVTREEGG